MSLAVGRRNVVAQAAGNGSAVAIFLTPIGTLARRIKVRAEVLANTGDTSALAIAQQSARLIVDGTTPIR